MVSFWQGKDTVFKDPVCQDSTYICWCLILWTTEWFWFGPHGIILASNIILWTYKIPICLTTDRTVSIVALQKIQYSLTVHLLGITSIILILIFNRGLTCMKISQGVRGDTFSRRFLIVKVRYFQYHPDSSILLIKLQCMYKM